MSNYQPKVDPEALVAGYTGADPRFIGQMTGYLTRQTPESKTSKLKEPAVRDNPYLKK